MHLAAAIEVDRFKEQIRLFSRGCPRPRGEMQSAHLVRGSSKEGGRGEGLWRLGRWADAVCSLGEVQGRSREVR